MKVYFLAILARFGLAKFGSQESHSPMSDNLALAIQPATQDAKQREVIHKMLSEMLITLSDKVFIEREFCLDGYRFINCRFEKCTLKIFRGTFELHHCWLDPACNRILGGDAQKVVQFYSLKDKALQVASTFAPTIYPDGTISIGTGASLA